MSRKSTVALQPGSGFSSFVSRLEDWRPTPGTELVGTIVGGCMRDGPYGAGRQMLVQTVRGNVVAVWLTAFLEKQPRIQEPETGYATRPGVVEERLETGAELDDIAASVMRVMLRGELDPDATAGSP